MFDTRQFSVGMHQCRDVWCQIWLAMYWPCWIKQFNCFIDLNWITMTKINKSCAHSLFLLGNQWVFQWNRRFSLRTTKKTRKTVKTPLHVDKITELSSYRMSCSLFQIEHCCWWVTSISSSSFIDCDKILTNIIQSRRKEPKQTRKTCAGLLIKFIAFLSI